MILLKTDKIFQYYNYYFYEHMHTSDKMAQSPMHDIMAYIFALRYVPTYTGVNSLLELVTSPPGRPTPGAAWGYYTNIILKMILCRAK